MIQIRRPFWVVIFIVILGFWGLAWTHSNTYARLLFLSIFIIICAWVWTFFSLKNINVKRISRGKRQQVGQVFEEQFEVTNGSRFTKLWMEVEDKTFLIGSGTTRIISQLKGRSLRTFSSYMLLTKRGEFKLGDTIISSGDPFGFFVSNKIISGDKQNLIVLPYLVDLKKFPSPSGVLPGGVSVRRRTPEKSPPQVAGVRDYAPGDGLNRIHWRTTARRERWMVKEFEEDPQADAWIFLDADSHSHFQTENFEPGNRINQQTLWWLKRDEYRLSQSTFEYSVSIAASIAKYLARTGQVVGFAAAGQQKIVLPAEKGERQLNKILQSLALIESNGELPITGLIEVQINQIPKGSMVVVITSSILSSLSLSVVRLIRNEMKPILILIDPVSFGGLSDNRKLVSDLQKYQVPIKLIKYGDNIKQSLEESFLN
jgi:uncharacterized protein (DUF58 family)